MTKKFAWTPSPVLPKERVSFANVGYEEMVQRAQRAWLSARQLRDGQPHKMRAALAAVAPDLERAVRERGEREASERIAAAIEYLMDTDLDSYAEGSPAYERAKVMVGAAKVAARIARRGGRDCSPVTEETPDEEGT